VSEKGAINAFFGRMMKMPGHFIYKIITDNLVINSFIPVLYASGTA
jgi:hypothetical protein